MGSSCVTTASTTVPVDWTTLPGSTRRSPTRPAMGAVMWQKSTCTWSYCTVPWSFFTVPSVLEDELLLVVELLLGDGVPRPRGAVPLEVHLGLGEDVLVALERPLRLQERRLGTAAGRCRRAGPRLDALPLLVVHGDDEAAHLARDRGRVDGRDRADRLEVDVDVPRSAVAVVTATLGGGGGATRARR